MALRFVRLSLKGALNSRNFASTAAVNQKVDPIQQLFLDKIKEYKNKSSKTSDGLVDADDSTKVAFASEVDRLDNIYQAKGKDFTKFPTFNFAEPTMESVDLGIPQGEPILIEAPTFPGEEGPSDDDPNYFR